MTINTFSNYETLSEATANLIINVLKQKPEALICIASGDTPLGVCKLLAKSDKNLFEKCNYSFQKMIKTEGGNIEIHLQVEKGIIEKAKFYGDFFNINDVEEIENSLVNCKHEKVAIAQNLSVFNIGEYFNNTSKVELIDGMF